VSVNETLEQLEPDWLDGVLREAGHNQSKVTDLRVEPLALSGATTDMARLRITYADSGAGPESLVAKIRGGKPVQVQMDQAMGLFERERRFYVELADRVPVRTAALVYAGDGDDTPLLLQDLGALRMGDQQHGLAVDDAAAVMDSLAALHARFWQSPELMADWLVSPTEGVYCQMIAQVVASGAPAVAERFAGRVSDATLAAVTDAAQDWHHVLERCAEGPHTLTHNDCRLDNVFFDDVPASQTVTPYLIDWQVPAGTRGTQDVANLLAGSMKVDDLERHWEELVARYHDGLLAGGVCDYTRQQCIQHYRQSVIYPLGQGLALLGALDTGDGRGIGDISVLRCLKHIEALDAFSTL
jgi:Ecdysteroid kinase-like family